MCLSRWRCTAVRRGVHVGTVLDLHRIVLALHETPEFALDIRLSNDDPAQRAISQAWCEFWEGPGRVTVKPGLAECLITSLETRQRMLLALVKAKVVTISEQAGSAEPLVCGNLGKGRVETKCVEPWRI